MSVDLLARLVFELRKQKDELAHGALAAPSSRDAFEYGRVSGMYAGLSEALALVERIFRESNEVPEHDGTTRRDARDRAF